MSRHRDIRRMDYSEEYGTEEVYGRSLEEEYAVSPTSAQFIFNRETSQGASLMSYISSKDPIPISPLNISNKSDTSVMSFDIKVDAIPDVSTTDVQLHSGVEYIRGIVSDQFSEDQMVEAMKRCNMNAEAALNHLLEKGHTAGNNSSSSSNHHARMSKRDSHSSNTSHTVFNAHHDDNVQYSSNIREQLDTSSQLSLSSLASIHMQSVQGGHTDNDQNSMTELSLSDLANLHAASLSSPVIDSSIVKDTSLSTDGLSLTDLANLHTTSLEGQEETNCSSNNLSLAELAGMYMSTDTSCSANEEAAPQLPLLNMNAQLQSMDFTRGFTIPKTGPTLSLSQLASLGSNTATSYGKSPKLLTTAKSPLLQNTTSGLAALATAHLSCSDNDNVTSSVDLSTVKPPPGLVPANINVVNTTEDTSLTSVVERLRIEDAGIVPADRSLFAAILCMSEREKPKRLIKRHGHLKRKSWRTLINPYKKHIPFFTFTTPSPDDYVLQKQRQVFNS